MTLDEVLEALASVRAAGLAIIGAVARNAWAPPRATTDLDVAVSADGPTLTAVADALTALGFQRVREQRVDPSDPLPDLAIFRRQGSGLRQVDILVTKTEFEAQALERAGEVDLGERSIRVVGPEDLVIYKLIAHRPRDVEDIRAILRTQKRAARGFDEAHVEHWAAWWDVADRWTRIRSDLD